MKKPTIQSVPLEALRGIAALAVLISHADHNEFVSLSLLSVIEVKGFLGVFGVGLFFILSGYLIWTSALKTLPRQGGLRDYATHRATRLMPLYYVNVLAAALFIPMLGSHFEPDVTFESIWRHITFTQDLVPIVSRSLNPVLWSLTHEMLFYVLVPMLFFTLRRRRLGWIILAAVLLSLPSVRAYTGIFSSFAACFYLFVIGITAAERIRDPLPAWFALLAVCVFAIAAQVGLFTTVKIAAMSTAMVLFICALSVRELTASVSGRTIRAVLSPLALIGIVSYSLYIWHYLLFNVVSFKLQTIYSLLSALGLQVLWLNELYRGISVVALALLVATVSYWLIEKPSMGLLRRVLLRNRC